MRLFVRQILIFSLPVVFALGLLVAWPQNKPAAYHQLERFCRNGDWMYNRIFNSKTPVDIAFLGTSMTMCAVNDSLLEEVINRDSDNPLYIANLGYCRPGRNIQYTLLKDLLENKNPKWILLEATVKEPYRSHPQYPVIANSSDLLLPVAGFHDKYPKDLFTALMSRISILKNILSFSPETPDSAYINRSHAYRRDGAARVMSDWEKKKPTNPVREITEGIDEMFYRSNARFPKLYVKQMVELAEKHGAQVAFLYLPFYHSHESQLPMEKVFIEENGELWVGPRKTFKDSRHWMDNEHLNLTGATLYTRWLGAKLKKKIYEGE